MISLELLSTKVFLGFFSDLNDNIIFAQNHEQVNFIKLF